jgi:transposase
MARRSKLTPAVQAAFVQAIRVGATYKLACLYSGISEDTLARWRRLGEEGRPPYADFAESLKAAEGEAAVGWLAKIEQAAMEGSWQAAAWKLERRYVEDYGRQIQDTRHSGEGGGPLQITLVNYTDA